MNIEVTNLLYYIHQSMWKVLEEYPDKIIEIMKQGVEVCDSYMHINTHELTF